MTEWTEVIGSQPIEPLELDTISSPTTVYQRRNIVADVIEHAELDGSVTALDCWKYEERELSLEEYAATQSPATELIMQAVSDMEVNITMAFIDGGTV